MMASRKPLALHLGILALLLVLFFVLPAYHVGAFSRIMVLAIYAMGYNLLFGYTGLLSLGHAMFFAAGMYGFGLTTNLTGFSVIPAFASAMLAAGLLALGVGYLALRTAGVAFMIVTLMFAQTVYLIILYFGTYTRGDEGFVVQQAQRQLAGIDLTTETARYFTAFILFSVCFLAMAKLVQMPFGKRLIAIRENEERARMLGYDVANLKLRAMVISGVFSGVAGASYALLFGYVGASFAGVQYSIFPLLWVLLGGAGTTIGPLIGVIFMFYLIDISSGWTNAYMLVAGIVLVLLTLFAPQGIVGTLRKRGVAWLP
ncbi:Inner-membrane translocator [Sulfitobacter noctilucae]|uniref:branched-chain amino acid ABC transporter permease n=1 Tax=Sulfitobacter noctilucae TaxID=1342302 RepID=UPI00046AF9EB|nr:branched-chain amino acid ABC transporter permease [Sulfitobacter noctilucae]KIN70431.1 Inner-membrane translocator [Sulfitobacter noctilucae]